MTRKTESGFTMTELIVAVGVAAIIATTLIGGYRLGFLREAALSAEARSLAAALNYVRVRGLEDKGFAQITHVALADDITPAGYTGGTQYGKVELELQADTEIELKYQAGEFVTFAGLDRQPFGNLNDMAHRIYPIIGDEFIPHQIASNPERWQLEAAIRFPLEYSPSSDMSEVESYSPGAAFVKCLSRASHLIIRKQSTLVEPNDPKWSDPSYFVYRDKQIRIAMEPDSSGGVIPDDSIVISFDSMGYTTRRSGYRLWLMRHQDDPVEAMDENLRKKLHLKVVNVTPLGRAYLWKTWTKQEEEAYTGKEGL